MDIENTIHIILQTEEEQILNLPLDELSISKSVYRSLLRSGMETIGDIANCWDNIRTVRSIGEKAYGEISGALNLWYLKNKDFQALLAKKKKVEPLEESPGVASDRKLSIPIEALGLAPRVYRLLKRNKMDTIDEIQQQWEKIGSLKNIGPVTLNQIQEALDEFKDSGNSISMKREFLQSSQGVETPGHELRSIEDAWPIAPTATCYDDFNEIRIGALPLPPRVSRALKYNNINTIGQFLHQWHEINSFSRIGPAAIAQIRKAMEPLWADIGSTSGIFEATSNSREVSSDVSKDDKIPIERSILHLILLERYYPLLMNTGIYTIDQITCTRLEKLRSEKVLDTRLIRKIREAVQSWLDQDETRRIAYFELMNGEGMVPLSDGLDFEELLDGLMETLEPRWVKVLELRFGLKTGGKLTLEKIGKEHGVTRERIRQIEGEALNRLRQPSYLGDLRQSRIIAKMGGLIDQYGGLISESRLIDELQVKLDLNTYSMNGVAGLIKKIFEGNIRLYGSDIKLLYIPKLCSWTTSAWDTEPILNAADMIMDILSRAKLPLPWEDLYTSLVQEDGLIDLDENLVYAIALGMSDNKLVQRQMDGSWSRDQGSTRFTGIKFQGWNKIG